VHLQMKEECVQEKIETNKAGSTVGAALAMLYMSAIVIHPICADSPVTRKMSTSTDEQTNMGEEQLNSILEWYREVDSRAQRLRCAPQHPCLQPVCVAICAGETLLTRRCRWSCWLSPTFAPDVTCC
jgi:hypothetical protein